MDEVRMLELFYHALQADVRKGQADYLKSRKRIPLPLPLPAVDDLPADDEWKKLGFFTRMKLKRIHRRQLRARAWAERHPPVSVEDVLLKGYNAGIEAALKVMESEYKAFAKRARIEDVGGYVP